jgi:hypothetical protein
MYFLSKANNLGAANSPAESTAEVFKNDRLEVMVFLIGEGKYSVLPTPNKHATDLIH